MTTTKTPDQVHAELTQLVRHGWPVFRAWLLEQPDLFGLGNAYSCPTAKWLRSRGYNVDAVYYDCVVANGTSVNTNVPIVNGRLVNYHDCAASLPQHATVTGARLVEMIEDYASTQDRASDAEMTAFYAYHDQPEGASTMSQNRSSIVVRLTVKGDRSAALESVAQHLANWLNEDRDDSPNYKAGSLLFYSFPDERAAETGANPADEAGGQSPLARAIRETLAALVDAEIKNIDFADRVESAVADAVDTAIDDIDLSGSARIEDAVSTAVEAEIENLDIDVSDAVENAVEEKLDGYDFDLERKIEDEMESVDVEDKVRDAVRSALRSLSEDL